MGLKKMLLGISNVIDTESSDMCNGASHRKFRTSTVVEILWHIQEDCSKDPGPKVPIVD